MVSGSPTTDEVVDCYRTWSTLTAWILHPSPCGSHLCILLHTWHYTRGVQQRYYPGIGHGHPYWWRFRLAPVDRWIHYWWIAPPGQYWIFQALIAVMPFPVSWYRTLSQGLWIPHWKEHTDCTSLWWPPDRRIRISSTHKWCQQLRHSRDDLWPALVTNMETSCAPLMGDSVEVWGRWLRSPLASSTGIPAFDWPCSPGASTRLSIYGTHKTMLGVFLVYKTHQMFVIGRLPTALIVVGRTGYA